MKNGGIDEVETVVSRSLKAGVFISAAIMLAGLLMFLITGNSGYPDNVYPADPLQVLAGAAALKPYAVILAGLLILILTPVFRVGVSIIVFFKEKDYLYVKITSLVFVILIVSFLLGKVE